MLCIGCLAVFVHSGPHTTDKHVHGPEKMLYYGSWVALSCSAICQHRVKIVQLCFIFLGPVHYSEYRRWKMEDAPPCLNRSHPRALCPSKLVTILLLLIS